MARKNVLDYVVLNDQSLSASFNSPVTLVEYLDNISYQIDVTTSDSIGTWAVEVSNNFSRDAGGNVASAGTWAALTLSAVPVVNAANDVIVISLHQVPYKAIRLAYTSSTPGTGTCDVKMLSKQVGG